METNTGSNDKLPVIKYRDYAKAVIMPCAKQAHSLGCSSP